MRLLTASSVLLAVLSLAACNGSNSGMDVTPASDTGTPSPDAVDVTDVPVVDAVDASDTGPMCPATESVCSGGCVSLDHDPLHCGACDVACTTGQQCTAGHCVAITTDCRTTPTLCTGATYCDPSTGACLAGCGSDAQCSAHMTCDATHTCVCAAGYHDCGGTCVSNTDVATCGASCAACPGSSLGTATCDGTTCGLSCNAGSALCGGTCAACPTDHVTTTTCSGSTCTAATCASGYQVCATGCCVTPGWSMTEVVPYTTTLDYGQYPSVAVDAAGTVHVAFETDHALANFATVYGERSAAGAWTFDASIGAGSVSALLTLDGAGVSRMAGRDSSDPSTVSLWTRTGSAWGASAVGAGFLGAFPAAGVDSSGAVHVVYEFGTSGEIAHGALTAGATTWAVDSFGLAGGRTPALAIDPSDTIHVVYVVGNSLYHASRTHTGSAWTVDLIATYADPEAHPSLAAGHDGSLHVAFPTTGPSYEMVYGQLAPGGSTWNLVTVGGGGTMAPIWPSIGVDSAGVAHLIYFDHTTGYLYYATDGTGAWVSSVLDFIGSTNTGSPRALFVDALDQIHVVSHDDANHRLVYRVYHP